MLQQNSALLRRITSKNNGYVHCLNYLHSFSIKSKPVSHKKHVKANIFII